MDTLTAEDLHEKLSLASLLTLGRLQRLHLRTPRAFTSCRTQELLETYAAQLGHKMPFYTCGVPSCRLVSISNHIPNHMVVWAKAPV